MKGSHVAVAGGVFAAVLVACFAVLWVGSKEEASPKGEPVVLGPDGPEPKPDVPMPAPNPPSAALGGFGQVARLQVGYDATAVYTRTSSSAGAVVATWTLPSADVRDSGDIYRTVRLSGNRFVGVSDTGIRVLDARTGEALGNGLAVAKDVPDTALSPAGDWAVQPTRAGLSILDTATGLTTKVPASAKHTFAGPAGFGSENGWCAVLGEDNGKPAVFRVRKDGKVETVGTYRPNSDRGDASRIGRIVGSTETGRFVFERPAEHAPTPRLLAWNPPSPTLTALPAFNGEVHDAVRHFRLSADGKRCLTFDATALKVFDLENNRSLAALAPENLRIGDAAFTPDGGRVVVAYATQRIEGDAENTGHEFETLPGHAWVLDLTTKGAVGSKFQFADVGMGKGFQRLVLSADGSRMAVIETSGKVRLVDANRAFGGGVSTAGVAPLPSVKRADADY